MQDNLSTAAIRLAIENGGKLVKILKCPRCLEDFKIELSNHWGGNYWFGMGDNFDLERKVFRHNCGFCITELSQCFQDWIAEGKDVDLFFKELLNPKGE